MLELEYVICVIYFHHAHSLLFNAIEISIEAIIHVALPRLDLEI